MPAQVTELGPAFTSFVNALLRAEVAAADLSGSLATTTYVENVGDEGVDAGLSRAVETRFIPSGDSAWQFKRGDLQPAKCKTELSGATAALEILRRGGKYRLVLGADINHSKVQGRRRALREEAAGLGIELEEDSVEVLTASDLAEWAESRPSLAVSQLLGGIRGAAEDFHEWSNSNSAATRWVESAARQGTVDEIRQFLTANDRLAIHIEGVSGLGKSRTVLEALRGHPFEPLVVYVRDADMFPASLVRYLTGEGRATILVVDDCDPRQHKNLEAALPVGSTLKLITIGEPAPSRTVDQAVVLPPIEDSAMGEILKLNRPNLWPEATYFVTDVASGNVRLALVLADAVEKEPRSSAARLVTAEIIRGYVTQALPEGISFLACCALALFTRIGYEGEPAVELQLFSEVTGLRETELRAGARTLAELGLFSPKGRFRSVSPQPLAVYLASRGWEEFETRIIDRLLSDLDPDLAGRLLQRAAEVGAVPGVLRAVDAILTRPELFGSVDALWESGYSRVLTQLAILAHGKVVAKLTEMLEAATDDELRAATAVRRDLVWTLEKLTWHSDIFERAADALLRLAINETEDYSNNASGTWCSLFGTFLPSTAAHPSTRLAYLTGVRSSTDVRIRALAAKAAATMLQPHETVMISAERQGGVLVEPRGRPATYGDVWQYQRAAIRMLRQFVDDEDQQIAEESLNTLVSAIHPYLTHQAIRGDLFNALKSLPETGLRRVRTQVTHLQGHFQRVQDAEERPAALDLLIAELPEPSKLEELRSLAYTQRWDLEDGELQLRITNVAEAVNSTQGTRPLFDLFTDELPAAFELGRSLAHVAPGTATLAALTPLAAGKNMPALVGYLWGLIDAGDAAAFDRFADSEAGRELDAASRLSITVRGPESDAGWRRVDQLVGILPVRQAASGLFGWHVGIETPRLIRFLTDWIGRIQTQYDYNAAIDFIGMTLFQKPGYIERFDDLVADLVQLRSQFPDTGQQSWAWAQLAKRQLDRQPVELLHCLVQLIDGGALHIFVGSEEVDLLKEAFRRSGVEGWSLVTDMLSAGSWRIQMDVRGWLVEQFSPDIVTGWIGTDIERAKLVASVATAGGDEPTPVARYLLDHFGNESRIAGPLLGEFWSGLYRGNESDHLRGQIVQLQHWVESPTEPEGVKQWARETIRSLEQHRERALRQEAEEDFF